MANSVNLSKGLINKIPTNAKLITLKLLKIKVVTLDGNDLTPKQYFQRDFVVKFLLSSLTQGVIVLFNGILLTYQCIRKQELRALHDMLVKTKVVHVK